MVMARPSLPRRGGLNAKGVRRKSGPEVRHFSFSKTVSSSRSTFLPPSIYVKPHFLSVLIIDDDPQIARLVATCLRSSGCILEATQKSKEGVALARKISPDVILCDADMPDLSGPQLIEMIKSDPATAHIPVVLMTGFADPSMFSHVRWTGFLGKPFTPSELLSALRHAVATALPKAEIPEGVPAG